MYMNILSSTSRKSVLDPRTKLLLLIFVSIFVIGNAGGDEAAEFRVILNYIPLVFLLTARRWKAFLFGVIFYTFAYAFAVLLMPHCKGFLNFIILAMTGIVLRFLPGILTGMYVVSTTTVSEFICAMERMHVSQRITIPLAVMFRFFPTVSEEAGSINKAMAMRDIKFGGTKALQMIEYRLIPMMTCSVKIGQELSAASLTRGLGGPTKRTNICKIGFGFWDILVFLGLGAGVVICILRFCGVL